MGEIRTTLTVDADVLRAVIFRKDPEKRTSTWFNGLPA